MNFGDSRLLNRFWRKVAVAPSGCWEWTGTKGRGQIRWKGRRVFVYRLTFEIEHGAIDPSLTIDHLCENPRCCNPEHLEQVTAVENTERFFAKRPVMYCPRGHAKTDDNVYVQPHARICKICHDVAVRAYNARVRPPRAVRFRDARGVIRSARLAVGLRLQDLATTLGVKGNTLSTWERGVRPIVSSALPGLEATIGVTTELLVAS